MGKVTIYCDGLCEPRNPGGYGCWAFGAFVDGQEVARGYGCLGEDDGVTRHSESEECVRQ